MMDDESAIVHNCIVITIKFEDGQATLTDKLEDYDKYSINIIYEYQKRCRCLYVCFTLGNHR